MDSDPHATLYGDFKRMIHLFGTIAFVAFMLILNAITQWAFMPTINAYNRHQYTAVGFVIKSSEGNLVEPVRFHSLSEALTWLKTNHFDGPLLEEKYWKFDTSFQGNQFGREFSTKNRKWIEAGASRTLPNGEEQSIFRTYVLYTNNWGFRQYYLVENGQWDYAKNYPKNLIEWLLFKKPFTRYAENDPIPARWED